MCTTVAPMPMGTTNITAKQFCAVSTFMSWVLLKFFLESRFLSHFWEKKIPYR